MNNQGQETKEIENQPRLQNFTLIWPDLFIHTPWQSLIVGPSTADSANSVQGCFSRVQKANGIAVIRKQIIIFTKYRYM